MIDHNEDTTWNLKNKIVWHKNNEKVNFYVHINSKACKGKKETLINLKKIAELFEN